MVRKLSLIALLLLRLLDRIVQEEVDEDRVHFHLGVLPLNLPSYELNAPYRAAYAPTLEHRDTE